MWCSGWVLKCNSTLMRCHKTACAPWHHNLSNYNVFHLNRKNQSKSFFFKHWKSGPTLFLKIHQWPNGHFITIIDENMGWWHNDKQYDSSDKRSQHSQTFFAYKSSPGIDFPSLVTHRNDQEEDKRTEGEKNEEKTVALKLRTCRGEYKYRHDMNPLFLWSVPATSLNFRHSTTGYNFDTVQPSSTFLKFSYSTENVALLLVSRLSVQIVLAGMIKHTSNLQYAVSLHW